MANQMFSTEQRVYIYDSYVLTQSASQVRRRFEIRFPGVKIPSRTTIHNLYNKFQATGSVQPKKKNRRRRVLTEETLDDIGHRLEQSPTKSLRRLSQQVGISYGSVQKATKLLKAANFSTSVIKVERMNNCTGSSESLTSAEKNCDDEASSLNEKKDGNDKSSQNTEYSTDEIIEDNPYAYLHRADFTSEKYKIEIRGLPKFYGIGELKKLLNEKLKLGSNKVKPPARGSYWVYVCFRSEEDRQNALKALDGYVWKSKTLSAEIAKPAPDPLVKRRREQTNDTKEGQNDGKKQKIDENRTQEERLKDSTIPLWNVSYEKQIEKKYEDIRNILLKMGYEIVRGNPALKPWVDQQRAKYKGLACDLWDVRSSPMCDGYRNKCEFTVGVNEETGERTVGFRLGSYVQGFTGVGPVDSLRHIPDRMKEAAKIFEKFVRASDLDVFNPETHEGYWRQLMVRLSRSTDQLMLVVGLHPHSLSSEQLQKVKNDLRQFFESGEGKTCKIASLYFQHIMKKQAGRGLPPLEHLSGETHIYETLLGLKFRVSPEAFFQTNTEAAEVLYTSVAELSCPTEDTTLIDICCGTGSIGLCLAKKCGQVLGLELLAQAVDDAKTNAEINNITNCDFFVGKAEDILSSVMNRATKKDVLAIVDPPRAGLHQKALVQLRRAEKLKKLVFLSCDPKAAIKNFVDLSRPTSKTYYGAPLLPVRAVPVDMFPHTSHCELIIYFERLDISKMDKKEKLFCEDNSSEKPSSSSDERLDSNKVDKKEQLLCEDNNSEKPTSSSEIST